MSKFRTLKIKDIRKETEDTVSIALQIENGTSGDFHYVAGQHLTFRAIINGEEVRRSYSLCSSPVEAEWRIAVKKVPGGRFSTYANEDLHVGDTVEVMPPMGSFTHDINPQAENLYVAFAAGSGITPVISLIKTILFSEPKSTFILFYGNRTTDGIIFREELEGIKSRFLDRFSIHHILSGERQESPLFNGRIDEDKCRVFSKVFFNPNQVDKFFLCGPEMMIENVKAFLVKAGVRDDHIKYELFTTPASKAFAGRETRKDTPHNPDEESLATVILDGDLLEFTMPYDGRSVLEEAIDHGADAPFACKGGVCCTCKARLVEGEVKMDVVYGLEPDEIENGYILTCQAHPRSKKIIVDFDV